MQVFQSQAVFVFLKRRLIRSSQWLYALPRYWNTSVFFQLIRKMWEKLSMFESGRKIVYCFIVSINYLVKSLYIVDIFVGCLFGCHGLNGPSKPESKWKSFRWNIVSHNPISAKISCVSYLWWVFSLIEVNYLTNHWRCPPSKSECTTF